MSVRMPGDPPSPKMRGLKVLRVIGPKRTRGGDFAVACEMSSGEVGAVILPRPELDEFLDLLQEEVIRTPRQKAETPRVEPTTHVDEDAPEMMAVARIEVREPVDRPKSGSPGTCELRFEDAEGYGASLFLSHNLVVHWRDMLNEQIARAEKRRN